MPKTFEVGDIVEHVPELCPREVKDRTICIVTEVNSEGMVKANNIVGPLNMPQSFFGPKDKCYQRIAHCRL